MKGCQIYKTNKHYKIITMYRQESWAYISSKPIYILPLEVDINEFSSRLFESLKNSRDITESEEDNFWLGNGLLKELEERTFVDLYKHSTSCYVWLDKKGILSKGEIEIKPNKYLGKSKGLVSVDEESIRIKYNKGKELEITKRVIDILNISG
jgi:hypothetical protein